MEDYARGNGAANRSLRGKLPSTAPLSARLRTYEFVSKRARPAAHFRRQVSFRLHENHSPGGANDDKMVGMDRANETKFKQMESDLKVLAERRRLAILGYLKDKKSKSVGEIADNINISFKATSKHLLYLAEKGILNRRYDGPFVLYRISGNLSDLNKTIISRL